MAADSNPRWISVGKVGGAHGIRGELAIRCDDPSQSALLHVREVCLGDDAQPRKVTSARATHTAVLIAIEGVNDRTQAEALGRPEVRVRRSALPREQPGEVYHADLAGLAAVDESGRPLGVVQGLWETGPVPVLVIGEGEGELLVPFAEPFIKAIRAERGEIVICPPEYDA